MSLYFNPYLTLAKVALLQEKTLSNIREMTAIFCSVMGSKLTDPVCKCSEYFARIRIAFINGTILKIIPLAIGFLFFGSLALFLTPLGAIMRGLGYKIRKNPFFLLYGTEPQIREGRGPLKVVSINVCGVGGQYCFTDGGVPSWPNRIEGQIKKILEQTGDAISILECFDIEEALYYYNKMKDRYHCFAFLPGGGSVSEITGAMFFASKYKTKVTFTPFSKDILSDRTQHQTKGIFRFQLYDGEEPIATIYALHLQHSERPAYPTVEHDNIRGEKECRREEMRLVRQQIEEEIQEQRGNYPILVIGDLNCDDLELREIIEEVFATSEYTLNEGRIINPEVRTYAGDEPCVVQRGGIGSPPLNLDHSLVVTRKDSLPPKLETTRVEFFTPYVSGVMLPENTLSDHNLLFSTIG